VSATDTIQTTPVTDAIVIGRNEGARLVACLDSLQGQFRQIIYVDSGSTDDSVSVAETLGATVVSLDLTKGFTAARARNAGLTRLAGSPPDLVQFIDGDCSLHSDWLALAQGFLSDTPKAAVACGRRRERHPDASIYNALCDHEWDSPIGKARACGGDALMRFDALSAVGSFRENLIAGEEPELCVRLRQKSWEIWRLDAEMTLHDADMHRLGQWAKRARRAGHAFAEGAALHGAPPECHWVKETRRAVIWGAILPAAIVIAALVTPWALLFTLIYPAQILRLRRRGTDWSVAIFQTLGKFPEAWGVADYWIARLRGQKSTLIEYK